VTPDIESQGMDIVADSGDAASKPLDSVDEIAVDNDVILKAVSYGVAKQFWSDTTDVGILGAAQYVVRHRLNKANLNRGSDSAEVDLDRFLARSSVLEPTDAELELASEIERTAQLETLPLDSGESQLAAIVVERTLTGLETGDKRAIRSFEQLVDRLDRLEYLVARIRCLEQIVLRAVTQGNGNGEVAAAVSAEPSVDTTLNICFGCYSTESTSAESAVTGLESYIHALRAEAPRMLAPS
jgi:hypothetical protein